MFFEYDVWIKSTISIIQGIKKKFIQQKGGPRPPRPTPRSAPGNNEADCGKARLTFMKKKLNFRSQKSCQIKKKIVAFAHPLVGCPYRVYRLDHF